MHPVALGNGKEGETSRSRNCKMAKLFICLPLLDKLQIPSLGAGVGFLKKVIFLKVEIKTLLLDCFCSGGLPRECKMSLAYALVSF